MLRLIAHQLSCANPYLKLCIVIGHSITVPASVRAGESAVSKKRILGYYVYESFSKSFFRARLALGRGGPINRNQKQFFAYMDLWKHGKYIDMWSIIHFLSGFALGGAFFWLGAEAVYTIAFSVLLLVLWEVFEALTNIIEPSINVIVDILIGNAGLLAAVAGYYWFDIRFNPAFFITVLAILLILALWGFIDFLKRGYR